MINQPEFGFVLEYVSDMEITKHFYTDVLGLKIQREHPTFVQFDHFALASDESMSSSRDPEIYWIVQDAEMALKTYSQNSEMIPAIKSMPFGKVFSIKDPEGQLIYFVEFVKQRPSQVIS